METTQIAMDATRSAPDSKNYPGAVHRVSPIGQRTKYRCIFDRRDGGGRDSAQRWYLYSYPTPERRRFHQMEPIQSMENVASFISFVNENSWSPLTCPLHTLSA